MRGTDVENIRRCYPLGGTLASAFGAGAAGATGGTIVFKGFGGVINSGGGECISIFGTRRVNGFENMLQPDRKIKLNAIKYFISYSMA